MATTQKGIYYPDDYTAIADVPEDMKDLAESVDTALDTKVDKEEGKGLSTYNFGTVSKGRLDSLWNNKGNIESNIARIKATLPTTTGTGENITLDKTAELDFIQPPLPRGNSEQVQTTQSANLFDENYYNNDSLYTTGTYKYALTRIKGNRTLYVKAVLKDGKTAISGLYVAIATNGGNPNLGTSGYIINSGTANARQVDFTGLNDLYFSFYPTNTNLSVIFDTYNIMVSTDNVVYVPFIPNSPSPDYPQPITNVTGDVEVLVQNKNLFATSKMQNGFIPENGSYPTQNSSYPNAKYILIPLKANQSISVSGSTANMGRARCIDITTNKAVRAVTTTTNDYFTSTSSFASGFTEGTITAKQDIIIGFMTLQDVDLSSFQIEYNTTATTYTPHKEQTFTFPLGTQRMFLGDYLADDGIHHVMKRVVLDGNENESWTLNSTQTVFVHSIDKTGKYISGSTVHNILANQCKSKAFTALYNGSEDYGIAFGASAGDRLCVRNKDITTVENWRTWLSTHNLIVEYELATEEITPYTTEQQTAYEEIKQALSYEEQTNISGTSDESNPLFSVEAYQSIKLILAS